MSPDDERPADDAGRRASDPNAGADQASDRAGEPADSSRERAGRVREPDGGTIEGTTPTSEGATERATEHRHEGWGSYQTWDRLYAAAIYGSAALFAAVILFPIYWIFQSALTQEGALVSSVTWYPTLEAFTVENFAVLVSGSISTYVFNTIVVTVGTMVAVVVISLIAGYGMARYRFRFKKQFSLFLLLGYMFSPIVLGLPLYLLWRETGLLDQRVGLIIALTAISMPFAVWLMWKYIQTIPESLEESAWIAGATRWQSFWHVIVPQTKPAIVACALFAFAIAWNDFTFAQILLPSDSSTTFAPGVMRTISQGGYQAWSDVMAASFAMTLPPLLFAYFLQEYLLKGFEVRAL